MLCEYGCNQESKFQLKNGKWCCSKHYNSCPSIKEKNSKGVAKAHKDGRCTTKQFDLNNCREWSKGKTIFSDNRLERKHKKEDVFKENSTVGTGYVKKILKLMPEFEHKCIMCNNTEWLGKPIALELDHVNGDHYDNRKENLRFLCPNCHATTETWKGRNKNGKKKIVSDEEMIDAIKTTTNVRQALMKVGLSAMGKNYTRAYELKLMIDKQSSNDKLTNVENNIVVEETQVVEKSTT